MEKNVKIYNPKISYRKYDARGKDLQNKAEDNKLTNKSMGDGL